ncbi:MAG TPA: hypothetical protein VLB27_02215 [candidate division Zixibacteria bacterium]|nr:hypothetical protein [candidate division Zixibacteria bacterium]
MSLFSKKDDPNASPLRGDISTPALKMVVEGRERDVSFAELTLSNNLAQQALARLLIKKGLISAEELLEAMAQVRRENYPGAAAPGETPTHNE